MPRFYFDVREGARFIFDAQGLEFSDLDHAEWEAAMATHDPDRILALFTDDALWEEVPLNVAARGTEAIREVLAGLPADAPAIVISQHIPAAFSKPFADRMNQTSAMAVCRRWTASCVAALSVRRAPRRTVSNSLLQAPARAGKTRTSEPESASKAARVTP